MQLFCQDCRAKTSLVKQQPNGATDGRERAIVESDFQTNTHGVSTSCVATSDEDHAGAVAMSSKRQSAEDDDF